VRRQGSANFDPQLGAGKTRTKDDHDDENDEKTMPTATPPSSIAEFAAGQLLFFKKGTVHALPGLIEQPVVFLAVDTPQRDPKDIIFVDPAAGSPETFVRGM
jgi:hypothetical protein